MLKRALTVVVVLPILILIVFVGGIPLIAICALAALIGLREINMAVSSTTGPNNTTNPSKKRHLHIHSVGYLYTIAYFAAIHFFGTGMPQFLVLTLFFITSQVCVVIFFNKIALLDYFGTVYGFLHIPVLASFIVMVRGHEYGNFYVWLIFTSSFGCDTFAYLTGTTIGKHKLTGTPSPKKSVEGVIGGIIGAAFLGGLYAFIIGFFGTPPSGFVLQAVVICAICAAFCVIGDMSASAIKRFTGIKDFGNIFPGHGGMIDRMDSIVVAAPIVFICITVITLIS